MLQMLSSEVVVKYYLQAVHLQLFAWSLRIDPLSVLLCTQTETQTPPRVWGEVSSIHLSPGTHPSPLPAYATDDAQAR